MIIQYVSDVHLEIPRTYEIPRTLDYSEIVKAGEAEILVLAGDIGKLCPDTLTPFLDYTCANWKHVLYVAGNHEFYNKRASREKTVTQLRKVAEARPNLHFLDRDIVVIDGQRFLGCTLWSQPITSTSFNDFKQITTQDTETTRKPITARIMRQWHLTDRQWLYENVQAGDIVITHFMPLTTKDLVQFGHDSAYLPDIVNDSYFGNHEMEDLVSRARYWISGHTHQAFRVNVSSCIWVCNPQGYPYENTGHKIVAYM